MGDEYPYSMECKEFTEERKKKLLPDVCTRRPNIHKFNNLFSSENETTLEKLCRFIKIVTVKVPPG
jgi:hypothetical protein